MRRTHSKDQIRPRRRIAWQDGVDLVARVVADVERGGHASGLLRALPDAILFRIDIVIENEAASGELEVAEDDEGVHRTDASAGGRVFCAV